eukprot:CAMPEP_0177640970 /NCGR_PEP_ID=MMETSP0447-20121125/6825_1 /TAXON_ID=0 /ORGANISM="Stygamoeba regulata, Strain BSH-02190019" /LENGTH=143 /DNA_ID=CAMNT_0019143073 /DNA_START=750 /DNA_END=1181 /DNA_ORIENTATION=+
MHEQNDVTHKTDFRLTSAKIPGFSELQRPAPCLGHIGGAVRSDDGEVLVHWVLVQESAQLSTLEDDMLLGPSRQQMIQQRAGLEFQRQCLLTEKGGIDVAVAGGSSGELLPVLIQNDDQVKVAARVRGAPKARSTNERTCNTC